MRKNISRKFIYGWKLWKHIERERRGIGTNQMERWHLRDMHQGSKVAYLAHWLSSHIATRTGRGNVTVRSTWIDQYPQAHTDYQVTAGASTSQVSVELADLLLVVKFQDITGATFNERAILLQAKCVDDPEALDPAHAGSSTEDERHLLEACCAPIRVTTGAGRTTPPINSARSDYDLGTSSTNLGLQTYARYLLVPRDEIVSHLPYMTVWPSTLSTLTGSPAHFSQVMLGMIGVSNSGAFAGASVNTSLAVTGWDHLVSDLIVYCDAQPPLNRFKAKTGSSFPRHIECTYDVKALVPFSANFSSFLTSRSEGFLQRNYSQFQTMHEGIGRPPPPIDINDSQDQPIGGFRVLQVTVNLIDRIDSAG